MKSRGIVFAAIPLAFVVGCGPSGSGAVAPAAAVSTAAPTPSDTYDPLAGLPTNPPTTEPPAPVAPVVPPTDIPTTQQSVPTDIDKIAAVNSDCQNYSTLDKPGTDLCNIEVSRVRAACNGDDTDRGAFMSNNGLTGGLSEAEAELSALCPEKAHQ
jgi:hypothetical protein